MTSDAFITAGSPWTRGTTGSLPRSDTMKDKFNLTGTSITDFELPGSDGKATAIAAFKGKKHVVIVLLRNKH